MHVRIVQEKVRKLEEENATLRLQVAQLKEQMQKAHDAGKKEVCGVCLFHTRMRICVHHVSGNLCICR